MASVAVFPFKPTPELWKPMKISNHKKLNTRGSILLLTVILLSLLSVLFLLVTNSVLLGTQAREYSGPPWRCSILQRQASPTARPSVSPVERHLLFWQQNQKKRRR